MLSEILVALCAITAASAQSFGGPPVDWVDKDESGAYQFGYATGDEGKHYHVSSATANNQVSGRFGYKDPVTGGDLQTTYTAGRKGFRARGPHIARHMDLSQNRPPFARPNKDGKYIPELDNVFDPNEDRGYDFSYRTGTHVREEHADRVGDVQGRYSYVDDVGHSHTVNYIAGAGTGFVVTNGVPDTFARARGRPLYFVGKRPGPKIRGFHSIQKTLDGSYRFEASGPDHKRSEVSDAVGNRRGTYTYLDDKGVQHTVEYIAGPNIGYKIINNRKGTSYNPVLPYFPDSPTLGPFGPSFPTTTLRPFGFTPGFGSSDSGLGSTFSPLPDFPLLPTEPTKFPARPSVSTPAFPTPAFLDTSEFSSGRPDSVSPTPSKIPHFPYGVPDHTSLSGTPSESPHLGGSSTGSPHSGTHSTGPSHSGGPSSGSSFPGTSSGGSPYSGTSSSDSHHLGGSNEESHHKGGSSTGSAYPGSSTSNTHHLGGSGSGSHHLGGPRTTGSTNIPIPTIASSFFPPSVRPETSTSGFGSSDHKWDHSFELGFNNPLHPGSKDWLTPSKNEPGKKPRPGTSSNFPFFKPPFGSDAGSLQHNLFGGKGDPFEGEKPSDTPGCGPDGKNETGHSSGTRAPKPPYRGSIKFGGVRRSQDDKERREEFLEIPPGVAVRAHVQSLDIVPLNKRFTSPGEALAAFGKTKDSR